MTHILPEDNYKSILNKLALLYCSTYIDVPEDKQAEINKDKRNTLFAIAWDLAGKKGGLDLLEHIDARVEEIEAFIGTEGGTRNE